MSRRRPCLLTSDPTDTTDTTDTANSTDTADSSREATMNDHYLHDAARQRTEAVLAERRTDQLATRLRLAGGHAPGPARREVAGLLHRLADRIHPGAARRPALPIT
ncbi:hypothetical protein [Actinopolymorpha singaporensis]|uniref:Uncharacterized protein n=1 Tax=Actinopolymorpha singaporensis TaxID=117157 RepID=A0A1H1NRF7_9ACTN|nr:hypothetical protein [Actinopolymorpha singaporensis]SDS01576.1 hypothetical protein SAMN04489717_1340 [Actinopolymorpha singaporensis]